MLDFQRAKEKGLSSASMTMKSKIRTLFNCPQASINIDHFYHGYFSANHIYTGF